MRRFDRRYMMAMHCTRKLALEKILGLHYRGFEILSRVFTRPCEISPSKNSHFSTRVEKVRLGWLLAGDDTSSWKWLPAGFNHASKEEARARNLHLPVPWRYKLPIA